MSHTSTTANLSVTSGMLHSHTLYCMSLVNVFYFHFYFKKCHCPAMQGHRGRVFSSSPRSFSQHERIRLLFLNQKQNHDILLPHERTQPTCCLLSICERVNSDDLIGSTPTRPAFRDQTSHPIGCPGSSRSGLMSRLMNIHVSSARTGRRVRLSVSSEQNVSCDDVTSVILAPEDESHSERHITR